MTKRICSIPDCGKPARTRGWCGAHYWRWYKHGDPLGKAQPVSMEQRFWAKVVATDGCWFWIAGKADTGYGSFHPPKGQGGRRTVLAHRFSYERLVGPIPEGLELDHLCRNRGCVSPFHLEPVTPSVNVRRAFKALGRRLLPEADIIRFYEAGDTTSEIADRFGTDPGNVYRVLVRNGVRVRSTWETRRSRMEATR